MNQENALMNKAPLKDRLADLMRSRKIVSEAELARRSGVNQPTIHRILTGESKNPRTENLEKIARALGVSVSEMREGGNLEVREAAPPRYCDPVPVVSWIAAGQFQEASDPYQPGDAAEWLPCPVTHGPRTFSLRVRGISMEPDFRDGDYIFVDPDVTPRNRSFVVVRLDDRQEATFKQLIEEDGRRMLRPLNPAWPEQIVEINGKATICGVVVFTGRKP